MQKTSHFQLRYLVKIHEYCKILVKSKAFNIIMSESSKLQKNNNKIFTAVQKFQSSKQIWLCWQIYFSLSSIPSSLQVYVIIIIIINTFIFGYSIKYNYMNNNIYYTRYHKATNFCVRFIYANYASQAQVT